MKNNVLLCYKRTRWHSVIRDSSIHRTGLTTSQHQPTPARHTGFKAVSTGWQGNATLSTCWIRPWRKLILASRQYPQCEGNTKTPTPVTPQTQSHHHQSTTYKARQTDQTHLYPNPCPNPQDATVCRYYRRISEQTHPHPNLRF